jgi:alkylated DNA repair dioxygenase AlkB
MAEEWLIKEDGAFVLIIRGWLNHKSATDLCEELKNKVKWEVGDAKPSETKKARRIYSCVDDGVVYKYNKNFLANNPWSSISSEVVEIRDRIAKESGSKINSCLINEYADGNCSIGYHSDKEISKYSNLVITVSLGGDRDFYFKDKRNPQRPTIKTILHNGDCVLMFGECQNLFTHSIPKRAHSDYRISLTFRYVENH